MVVATRLQPVAMRQVPGGGLITCMKSLAVRVLGDFGVDGVAPQALGSRKARLTLQMLAIAGGQAVPAGVLIDALLEKLRKLEALHAGTKVPGLYGECGE